MPVPIIGPQGVPIIGQKPVAVVFDIDGVLADSGRRAPRVFEEGWSVVAGTCHLDSPLPLVHVARAFAQIGVAVILVTARPKLVHAETQAWLKANHVPYNALLANPEDDSIDWDKSEAFKYVAERFQVLAVFDDSPAQCRRAAAFGLPVVPISSGIYGCEPETSEEEAE